MIFSKAHLGPEMSNAFYKFPCKRQLLCNFCLALALTSIRHLCRPKMASTLLNMSFCAPTSCSRINKFSNVKFLTMSRTRNVTFCNHVKATAGGEASLQRAKQQQQQQLQPKMKRPQASPAVLLNQFPVARTVQQMMDTMERIVEDPWVYSTNSPFIVAGDDEYSKGNIPWAIKEGEKYYKMRFNMPGMNKNDVKAWIEENMLVVKAEKVLREHHEGQANGSEELSMEQEQWPAKSYGRYSHRIALPENIEFEKIKAQVKDGILYITIPKTNTSGKTIDIDVL